MANQVPLQDDIQFWSRQLTEHALFLHLLLQDPVTRAQAQQLYNLWQSGQRGEGNLVAAVDELIAFKTMVLDRLQRGEWLGWALPSFVSHIRMEALYFRSRLVNGVTSGQEIQTWLQIVKDHADVGPKLIDPQANAYANQAVPLSDKIAQLQGLCTSLSHQCLTEADQAMQTANAWVEGIPAGLNIVHPALKAHILRENSRGIQVTRLVRSRIA